MSTNRRTKILGIGFLFAIILGIGIGYVYGQTSVTITSEMFYYEEQYYKLLVALSTPSLIHFKYGAFSYTPTENIYSAFKIFVRYAGLTYNYVDVRSPPNPLYAHLTKHTPSEGAITGQGATSSFFYVLQSDVDGISNAKALWFRRMNWLQTTSPTRIVLEEVEPGVPETLNFSSGTYGSFITNYIGSGYKLSVRFSYSGTNYQAITNIESRTGGIGTEDPWGYSNGEIFLATKDIIDATSIQWQIYVAGDTNPNFNFKAYMIIEKYDVPSWWATGS